jgi:hypothetical protein
MAVGSVQQDVTIAGETTRSAGDPPSGSGGFLALASNSGEFSRNRFAAIPEMNVTLGYQLSPCWRANVGYTFLYVSNVVRPGDQIDLINADSFDALPVLDSAQFFPPQRLGSSPRFNFHDTDMWVQGINIGLECRF